MGFLFYEILFPFEQSQSLEPAFVYQIRKLQMNDWIPKIKLIIWLLNEEEYEQVPPLPQLPPQHPNSLKMLLPQ